MVPSLLRKEPKFSSLQISVIQWRPKLVYKRPQSPSCKVLLRFPQK